MSFANGFYFDSCRLTSYIYNLYTDLFYDYYFSFLPGLAAICNWVIDQFFKCITILLLSHVLFSFHEFALMFFIGSVDYELRAFAGFSD